MNKHSIVLSICCLGVMLTGCVVDVVEQSTERQAYGSGKNLTSVYFDASIYRNTFLVQGGAADTLIAYGTFSLWAPGSGTASAIAQNVNLFWAIDTLHQQYDTLQGQLVASALGSQKELLTIDKMSVTIPQRLGMTVTAGTTDVSVQGMTGDMNIDGSSSNFTFSTAGRITLQNTSGKITGSTRLGGFASSGTGDIDITLISPGFESIFLRDTSGNVTVHIPKGVGITFNLFSHGGNISLIYDNVNQSSVSAIVLPVNGGGKNVRVETGTGKINVTN